MRLPFRKLCHGPGRPSRSAPARHPCDAGCATARLPVHLPRSVPCRRGAAQQLVVAPGRRTARVARAQPAGLVGQQLHAVQGWAGADEFQRQPGCGGRGGHAVNGIGERGGRFLQRQPQGDEAWIGQQLFQWRGGQEQALGSTLATASRWRPFLPRPHTNSSATQSWRVRASRRAWCGCPSASSTRMTCSPTCGRRWRGARRSLLRRARWQTSHDAVRAAAGTP